MPSKHPSCPPCNIISSEKKSTHGHHLQAFSPSLQVLILHANLTNLTNAAANAAVTDHLCNIIHQVILTAIWHFLIWGREANWTGILPECVASTAGRGHLFSQLVDHQFFSPPHLAVTWCAKLRVTPVLLSYLMPGICSAHTLWWPNSSFWYQRNVVLPRNVPLAILC